MLEFKKVEQDLRLELGLWIKQLKRKEIIDAFLTGNFNKKKNGKYLIPKQEDRERGRFLYEKFGKSTVLNPFLLVQLIYKRTQIVGLLYIKMKC